MLSLQVAEGLFPHFPLQFNYMNIQVQDRPSEDMVIHFPKCFEFIDNAITRGGKRLVNSIGRPWVGALLSFQLQLGTSGHTGGGFAVVCIKGPASTVIECMDCF